MKGARFARGRRRVHLERQAPVLRHPCHEGAQDVGQIDAELLADLGHLVLDRGVDPKADEFPFHERCCPSSFRAKAGPHCRGRVPKGVAATQRRSREGAQRREVTMSVGYSGAGEQERPDCLGAVRKIAFRYISHEPPRHSLAQLLERGAPRADKDNADNPSEHIASMQRVRTSR